MNSKTLALTFSMVFANCLPAVAISGDQINIVWGDDIDDASGYLKD